MVDLHHGVSDLLLATRQLNLQLFRVRLLLIKLLANVAQLCVELPFTTLKLLSGLLLFYQPLFQVANRRFMFGCSIPTKTLTTIQ